MKHYPLTNPDGSADQRYALTDELRSDAMRWVLWIDGVENSDHRSLPAATLRAVALRSIASGAVIFTEQKGNGQ